MTYRSWINITLGALLLLIGATTCGYERGIERGKQIQTVQTDDSIRVVYKDSIAALMERTQIADSLAKGALLVRDTSVEALERSQARRDTARSFATAERSRFTLKGDTAVINGNDYVIPVAVSTYVRLSDTVAAKQGELDAVRATSDSNSSRTIARLISANATKDTALSVQRAALAHSDKEIADLKAIKTPRFGFVSGLLVGGSGVLLVVKAISMVVR